MDHGPLPRDRLSRFNFRSITRTESSWCAAPLPSLPCPYPGGPSAPPLLHVRKGRDSLPPRIFVALPGEGKGHMMGTRWQSGNAAQFAASTTPVRFRPGSPIGRILATAYLGCKAYVYADSPSPELTHNNMWLSPAPQPATNYRNNKVLNRPTMPRAWAYRCPNFYVCSRTTLVLSHRITK